MGTYNLAPIWERYQAYLLIILFGILGNISIAQQQNLHRDIDTNLKISQKKASTVSGEKQHVSASPQQYPIRISKKPGQEQVIHDEVYLNQELQRIDLHIKAIDEKIVAVNSNPEKKLKAQSEGWFEQMNITKESLLVERKEVLEALKPFQNK